MFNFLYFDVYNFFDQIKWNIQINWKLYSSFRICIFSIFKIFFKLLYTFCSGIESDMLFIGCKIYQWLSFIFKSRHLIPDVFFKTGNLSMNEFSEAHELFLNFYREQEDVFINISEGVFHSHKNKKKHCI
ncbi:hypothetical protein HX13_15155 [Chryseobacterium sp. P1-3]|nr:hypothetical protein HX13_15155 [Chryseobacterium sp. P1-3]